jgi:RNA polymerase sigma-70 factor, ECF subfamily
VIFVQLKTIFNKFAVEMTQNNTPSQVHIITEQLMKQLFKEHYRGLCLFARQFIHDNEKSEDIVQDVFLNIWEKKELNASDSQIKSYLYTSVRNRCLNYIRDHKKFNDNVEVAHIENTHEHNRTEYRELEHLIKEAIASLPEKCREVFELSRFKEMKYQEIADALGISIKTVEAQMSKALKVLREKLSGYSNGMLMFFMNFFQNRIRVNNLLCVLKL